ncbi:MAG: type II toxin-antitoxin system VapC family toxin [Nostocaceae cyanobacterium]|nr:type II toxin-antitoxin system VapC family toxin [Nostocaceae cyanobacterium]
MILDSGVLSLLASPNQNVSNQEENEIYQCTEWFESLLARGVYIVASEISDYEIRREFIRIRSEGITILDQLRGIIDFLPLTTEVMKKAAEFWADARQNHMKTADDKNIDADMIIAAQWSILSDEYPGRSVIIATKNLRHLQLFAQDNAQEWMNIKSI